MHEYFLFPGLDKKVQARYKIKTLPTVKELEQRTLLMLINTDNAVDYPEPTQPNMIQVGGLQIADAKPLPEVKQFFPSENNLKKNFLQKMEKFVNSGEKGTILMSLGTNMKSSMLGTARLATILETFAELPQYNFVWKFEADLSDLPVTPSENVFIDKFLPQNDILAHSNVIAFITHSGLLSTHETLFHGVPIVGKRETQCNNLIFIS